MLNKKYYTSIKVLLVFMLFFSQVDATEPTTPEALLPSGVDSAVVTNPYNGKKGSARKGTIGAIINNITFLNKALLENKSSFRTSEDIQITINEIRKLIPSFAVLGMFDLFVPEEWLVVMQSNEQWGRIVCVLLYFDQYPNELTAPIKDTIVKLKSKSPSKVVTQLIDQVLITGD